MTVAQTLNFCLRHGCVGGDHAKMEFIFARKIFKLAFIHFSIIKLNSDQRGV